MRSAAWLIFPRLRRVAATPPTNQSRFSAFLALSKTSLPSSFAAEPASSRPLPPSRDGHVACLVALGAVLETPCILCLASVAWWDSHITTKAKGSSPPTAQPPPPEQGWRHRSLRSYCLGSLAARAASLGGSDSLCVSSGPANSWAHCRAGV